MIYGLTGFDIEKDEKKENEQLSQPKEIADKACSPVHVLPSVSPHRPPSTPLASLSRSKHQSIDMTQIQYHRVQPDRASSVNQVNAVDLQQDMQAMQDNYQ